MANIKMKTKGGYPIRVIEVLDKPIDRGILNPQIYKGIVMQPNSGKNGVVVYWDKHGYCSNATIRLDMNIDPSIINLHSVNSDSILVKVKIDPELLKEQKKFLLKILDQYEIPGNKLEGLVNMIDSIQDYMVDELGMDENKAFDLES